MARVHRRQVVIAIFTLKLIVRLGIEGLAGDRSTTYGTAEALRMIVTFLIDLHGIFGCESLSAGFTECFRQRTIGCWTTRHDRFLCLSARGKDTDRSRRKRMKCSRSSPSTPFHTSLFLISVFFLFSTSMLISFPTIFRWCYCFSSPFSVTQNNSDALFFFFVFFSLG